MRSEAIEQNITEEFEAFCKGCMMEDLTINAKLELGSNGFPEGKRWILTCKNIGHCRNLYDRLMEKEKENGNSI